MRHRYPLIAAMIAATIALASCSGPDIQKVEGVYDTVDLDAPLRWNPPPGTSHLSPVLDCDQGTTPKAAGVGAAITNDNVTMVNPVVRECGYGIENRSTGLTITFDPSQPGYEAAQFNNNRYALLVEKDSFNVTLQGLNRGEAKMVNNFRPVTVRALQTGVFRNMDISHPDTLAWQEPGDKNVVGFKMLCDFDAMPSSDRSCRDVSVNKNDFHGADEEILSADGNGNDTTTGCNSTVQNTAIISSLNDTARTITLDESLGNLCGSMVGAYLTPLEAGDSTGTFHKITAQTGASQTGKTLTLDATANMADLAVGQEVSMGGRYFNLRFTNNRIDMQGRALVGSDFGGPVDHSVYSGNTIVGAARLGHFGATSGMRDCKDGAGHFACQIAFALGSNGRASGPGTGDEVSMGGNNTIINNTIEGDIAMVTRHRDDLRGIPVYLSGNTFTSGQMHNEDGDTYRLLATTPN